MAPPCQLRGGQNGELGHDATDAVLQVEFPRVSHVPARNVPPRAIARMAQRCSILRKLATETTQAN
eukprot:622332-Lingulodinium_polyedra.AAC.1